MTVAERIFLRCATRLGRGWHLATGPDFRARWKWLYAPSPQAVEFAFRNTIAALIALAIALWMELDSPVWAPSTVWAVAQATRGESLSKARWRLAGTLLGGVASVLLIAAFPQEPWLFFPALAIWVGSCAGLATFFSSYRAYAMTLAGYTCAIIALDASQAPDNVFFLAVSRSTYIGLGVVCEAAMGMIFSLQQEKGARMGIRRSLQGILDAVLKRAADVLDQDRSLALQGRELFGRILRLNSEVEYLEIEMGPHGHEGDHARADLAAVAVLLTRCLGMTARLAALKHREPRLNDMLARVREFVLTITPRLEQEAPLTDILTELHLLRISCRDAVITPQTHDDAPASHLPSREDEVDTRVLYVSISEMLREIEDALLEYNASTHQMPRDRFRFRLPVHRDIREAVNNVIRVFSAIIICALFYEITAWPSGPLFISNLALICGLFATQENPVFGTTQFLRGALWSALIAGLLTMIFVPAFDTYETLILALFPPMFISGLARLNKPTIGVSSAFGLLMPTMLNIQNHQRLDEISFFNSAFAVVCAAAAAVLAFRIILPFNPETERMRLRRQMLAELRALCHLQTLPETRMWISGNLDRFAKLIRHAGTTPSPAVETYLRGTLATLTLGMNIIRLRALLNRDHLPDRARRAATLLLDRIERAHDEHVRSARVAAVALRRFRALEYSEADLMTRMELIRGIAYLVVIRAELLANAQFLDATRPVKLTG